MHIPRSLHTPKDAKDAVRRISRLPYGTAAIGAGLGYLGGYGSGLFMDSYYPEWSRLGELFPVLGAVGGGYLGYLAGKHASASNIDLTGFINFGKKICNS